MADNKKRRPGRRWPQGIDINVTTDLPRLTNRSPQNAVYDSLRYMILHGEIEPGAWLRQTELAERFGISRTPIREVLRTLEQDGLVEMIPNHGARVTELSLEAFEELYALRIGVEGLAARRAAESATAEDITQLRYAFDDLTLSAKEMLLTTYLREEWQFRLRCYEISGGQRLLTTIKLLREHAERYLRLAYLSEERIDESFGFHKRLIEAIAANDGAAAESINQAALRWTLQKAGPEVAANLRTTGG